MAQKRGCASERDSKCGCDRGRRLKRFRLVEKTPGGVFLKTLRTRQLPEERRTYCGGIVAANCGFVEATADAGGLRFLGLIDRGAHRRASFFWLVSVWDTKYQCGFAAQPTAA